MPTEFRELDKLLRANGWTFDHATGSHPIYVHTTHGSIFILEQAGFTMMASFTATLERAADGTWTAAVIGEHSVLGTGATRDAALDDLRSGIAGLIDHLKSKGKPLPQSSIELVHIEVAA